MNREQAKEKLPIILAFIEGKQIQTKNEHTYEWVDIIGLNSFFDNREPVSNYRVKPESREFWIEEAPYHELQLRTINLDDSGKPRQRLWSGSTYIKVREVIE